MCVEHKTLLAFSRTSILTEYTRTTRTRNKKRIKTNFSRGLRCPNHVCIKLHMKRREITSSHEFTLPNETKTTKSTPHTNPTMGQLMLTRNLVCQTQPNREIRCPATDSTARFFVPPNNSFTDELNEETDCG